MQPLASGDLDRISRDLGLDRKQVERTLELLDQGFSVPFIARFRAHVTGGLTEAQVRQVRRAAEQARALAKSKATLLKSLEARQALTDQLRQRVLNATDPHYIQDLYLPFGSARKQRERRTAKAIVQLADAVWQASQEVADLEGAISRLAQEQAELGSADEIRTKLREELRQRVVTDADARHAVREYLREKGVVRAELVESQGSKAKPFAEFKDFSAPIQSVSLGAVFRMLQGERRGALRLTVAPENVDAAVAAAWNALGLPAEHPHGGLLREVVKEAIESNIVPQVGKEVKNELAQRAEEHQLELYGQLLRDMLLRPGIQGRRILAIDPGLRTGCKCVALDEQGNPLEFALLYPHEPLYRKDEAKAKLRELVQKYELDLAVIGDGTACRETEELIAEVIADGAPGLEYIVVPEAGAEAYAQSQVGREEFPKEPIEFRSAVSVGRRAIDPLAELTKIVPTRLCPGFQPSDFRLVKADRYLNEVVRSCVAEVGVDVNRASRWLLRYVPGLNDGAAAQLVRWRKQHGAFRSRRQLLLVDAVDEKRFIECSGFLRISDGESPLDATWIHPEHYAAASRLLELAGVSLDQLFSPEANAKIDDLLSRNRAEHLAEQLEIEPEALRLMVPRLKEAYRDPRQEQPGWIPRRVPLTLERLQPGMEVDGRVERVVQYGAFVDIGVEVKGLVHITRMKDPRVQDARDVVCQGHPVRVWVVGVDRNQKRLSLAFVPPEELKRRSQRPARERAARRPRRPAQRAQQPQKAAQAATEPARPSRTEQFRARQQKAAQQQRQRKETPKKEPVKLSEEALSGKQPLRGFDELKALWDQLHSSRQ